MKKLLSLAIAILATSIVVNCSSGPDTFSSNPAPNVITDAPWYDADTSAAVGVFKTGGGSSASGAVIADGVILTAGHVSKYDITLSVRFDNGETSLVTGSITDLSGGVLGGTDLGVVFTDTGDITPYPVKCAPVVLGQTVWTIGNPLTLRKHVAVGIVSTINPVQGRGGAMEGNYIITDLNTERGSSGSPILDTDSNVIGVLTAGYFGTNMHITVVKTPERLCEFLRANDIDVVYN